MCLGNIEDFLLVQKWLLMGSLDTQIASFMASHRWWHVLSSNGPQNKILRAKCCHYARWIIQLHHVAKATERRNFLWYKNTFWITFLSVTGSVTIHFGVPFWGGQLPLGISSEIPSSASKNGGCYRPCHKWTTKVENVEHLANVILIMSIDSNAS